LEDITYTRVRPGTRARLTAAETADAGGRPDTGRRHPSPAAGDGPRP